MTSEHSKYGVEAIVATRLFADSSVEEDDELRSTLGEGPSYHNGIWTWADISTGRIFVWNVAANTIKVIAVRYRHDDIAEDHEMMIRLKGVYGSTHSKINFTHYFNELPHPDLPVEFLSVAIPATTPGTYISVSQRGVFKIVESRAEIIDQETVCIHPAAAANLGTEPITLIHAVYYLDDSSYLVSMDTLRGLQERALGVDLKDKPVRINDSKVDPRGRLLAGTLDMNQKDENGGVFLIEHSSDKSKKVSSAFAFGPVTISNGMDWTPTLDQMFYTDTPLRTVDVFDYKPKGDLAVGDSGLTNRRVFVDFNALKVKGKDRTVSIEGFPDGMVTDTKGNLYVAVWQGGRVLCIDGQTGELFKEIVVPGAAHTTSCCFGGPDMNSMIITTIRKDRCPNSGHTHYVPNVGMTGSVTNLFRDV